jgi:dihydrofolate reductase
MRKVLGSLFISFDGVVESPDQWQFDAFDEDMMAEMITQIGLIDDILMGRVTYGEWSPYWPSATDEPFASFINQTPKHVFSRTLDTVSWGDLGKIELIKGNLAQAIGSLKQQPGRNIGVTGSPTLVRSLLAENLLDQLHLQVHPVIVGKGRRLFQEGDDLKRLNLVDSRTTSTGVLLLTYQPRQSE